MPTRVAQELEGSRLHIFVSQNCCHPRVMSRSLPHLILTTSTSSLSPNTHKSFRQSHQHTQVLWRTIHIYPAKIHDRVADQHKSHLSQVMSPKSSSPKTLSREELSLTGILGRIHNKGKLPGWEKSHAKTVAWSYEMEGHAKKCVARHCELANEKTEQL